MRTVINPDEARRFATMLKNHADELRRLDSAVSRRLLELHASNWRDAKYDRFERRYEEASVLLQTFTGAAERYATYLNRKAALIEPYLRRNY
jgi:hypothetical protein